MTSTIEILLDTIEHSLVDTMTIDELAFRISTIEILLDTIEHSLVDTGLIPDIPRTSTRIAQAIRDAINDEREACAQIADRAADLTGVPEMYLDHETYGVAECAEDIAKSIRARGSER